MLKKKDKKSKNIQKFGQKCTKFESILKKGQVIVCDYQTQ